MAEVVHSVGRNQEPIIGKELGNKKVFWIEPDAFIVNIVFAWERAVATTTKNEEGMIASHRFPMYKSKKNLIDINFITYFFITNKGKYLLELASPGGAGRNKTLSQQGFGQLEVVIPVIEEQQKIVSFLTLQDRKIDGQQDKLTKWAEYKKGIMQKIFSQELRFRNDHGENFTEWEEVKISEVLNERSEKAENHQLEVCSVAVRAGVINQLKHLGRTFSAKDTSNYSIVKYGDVIYTKSPTGEFPFGIVKQSQLKQDVIVSPLYAVYKPENYYLGYILHSYFSYPKNTNNYLRSIVNKGAKNTINISNSAFVSKMISLPKSKMEQQKIADFLAKIDKKIELEERKLVSLIELKKGFVQRLLV